MGAPKFKPSELQNLYAQGKEKQTPQDKAKVETLIKRLNEQLSKDPALAKKAAAIIGNWLQSKPKK